MNNKKHKVLASATVMSLLISTVATVTPVKAAEVSRLGGATREITAVEVAKQVFGKADTVVVVNGYGYADAVSATPLAKQFNAPILLTNSNGTDVDVQAIKDLGAKNVYIIGGTGAVSASLAAKLEKDYSVTRIGGQNRYETNANVAKEVIKLTGNKEAVLVSAEGYADALSVASIAAAKGMPVLFGNSKEVPAAVKTVANGLDIKAVGGTGVLPESVLKSVDAERITKSAKNRFETNLEVLDYYKTELAGVKKVYMATGGKTGDSYFADALVASAAAAKDGAPVVLTGYGADSTQKDAANKYVVGRMDKDTDVKLVGGIGVLPDSDVKAVEDKKEELNKPVTPVETELKVESVSAVNAKEIKVVFNKEVNKEVAEVAANYTVKKANNALTAGSEFIAKLDDDKKTVYLQLTDSTKLNEGESYKVDVADILSSDYRAMNEYKGTYVIFSDKTAPILEKAVLRSDKSLRLTFNEPIVGTMTVKVDGVTVANTTTAYPGAGLYTATTGIIGDNDLTKAGTHTVTVYSATDVSGNTAAMLTTTYEVKEDTTAPSVAGLLQDGQASFKIKFSEAVSDLTSSNIVIKKGNYVFSNTRIASVVLDPDDTDDLTWIVTMNAADIDNPLYASGESSVSLDVTVKNYKDSANLYGAQYNGSVLVSKDGVAPKVKSADINSVDVANKKLIVIFDEKVTNAAQAKVSVVKDGIFEEISGVAVNGTDAKKVEITLTNSLSVGTYSVTFDKEAVKDLSGNSNEATTTTVKYDGAGSALTISADNDGSVGTEAAGIETGDVNKITVNYGKEMANSAIVLDNYRLDGAPLPSGTTIGFTGTSKDKVVITLPSGTIADGGSKSLTLSKNIKSVIGNTVKTASGADCILEIVNFTDNVKPVLQNGAFLVSNSSSTTTNRIKLTFNEKMAIGDTNDFKVSVNGSSVAVSNVLDGVANDRHLILELGSVISVNQAVNVEVVEVSASGTNISMTAADIAGNKLTEKTNVTISTKEVDVTAIEQEAAAIARINANLATTADYTVAGISSVSVSNLLAVNTAVAAAKGVKGSALTKSEIQTEVNNVEAIAAAKTALTTLTFDTIDNASVASPKIVANADSNGVEYTFTAAGTKGANNGELTIAGDKKSAVVTRSTDTADTIALTVTLKKGNATDTKVFNVTTSLTGVDVIVAAQ